MAVKTITITTDAYEVLANLKGPKDSFSDVILENYRPKKSPLWDLVGMLNDEETAELKENIAKMRKKMNEQYSKQGKEITHSIDRSTK